MRVVKEPEERKQEILETAIGVFACKGYDKTSISDIAKEMNISQGLCYRYFKSKEEIYDVALDRYADYIVRKHIQEWDFKDKTIEDIIISYCGVVDDFAKAEQEEEELYAIFHQGSGSDKMHNQLSIAVSSKLVPHVAKFLEESKKQDKLVIENPYVMAHFIVFGQMGILMNDSIPNEHKNKMIQETLLEFIRGIKKS